MKKIFFFIILAFVFSSCGKHLYSTMSSGKENESFIIVLKETHNNPGEIAVQIDEQQPITIDKVFVTKFQRKAKPVKITPGKHTLKVLRNGKVISTETIFLGLQETKKIILP